ncbi:sensor histidine kinase [Actinoplanes subtropicus]|uniref:sensor histidine kinase n=1 Tax=Actinoplanes subtropicus TaxID=543632 RepID=UPI0006923B11|nr:histidine kinase [Actinoplanes subtropicus]
MESFLETRAGRRLVAVGIAVLAAGVAAGHGLSASPPWPPAAWAAGVAAALCLLARPAFPLTVLAATVTADVASAQLLGADGVATAAALVAAATVASRSGVTMRSIPLLVAFTCGETFLVDRPLNLAPAAICALCQLAVAAGLRVGVRRDQSTRTREHVERLRERAAAAARETTLAVRSAAAEERLRIAQEVHDVLAHTLSVVVVQATAAADAFERSPAGAKAAVETIGDVARKALGDLRAVLASLHETGTETEDNPPARSETALSGLENLVGHVRAAGLDVSLDIGGDVPGLPPATALTAFRVIQEALTNTLRHAHAHRAAVTVRVESPELVVEVVDDGWGRNPARPTTEPWPGSGRGLTGMRSRVTNLGGTLATGNRHPRGFQVLARLPLPDGRKETR